MIKNSTNKFSKEDLKLESIPRQNLVLYNEICQKASKMISDERPIMYTDIINIIIREKLKGKEYTDLILWCNYNIKKGKFIVRID
jgi:flagellar basal body L-ring protein FlgH